MTKRDLLKWLEEKGRKAIEAARKEYEASRGKAKEAFLLDVGFEEMAAEMQGHIEKALDIWNEFQKKCGHVGGIEFNGVYMNPGNRLYEYVSQNDATSKCLRYNVISVETEAMKSAQAAYNDLATNISRNYQSVIAVVQSMRTAKEAAAYLTELGFDMSEANNATAPVTALAVQIDTSYLFLNKEAKAA